MRSVRALSSVRVLGVRQKMFRKLTILSLSLLFATSVWETVRIMAVTDDPRLDEINLLLERHQELTIEFDAVEDSKGLQPVLRDELSYLLSRIQDLKERYLIENKFNWWSNCFEPLILLALLVFIVRNKDFTMDEQSASCNPLPAAELRRHP